MADDNPASSFIQSIQRDLNCLSDPDRNTRRRALEKLHRRLINGDGGFSPPSVDVLQAAWDNIILQMVLKVFNDCVEKCRELAVLLATRVGQQISQVEQTTRLIVPVVAERIGYSPVLEDSEEIRLQYLNLLSNVLVNRCSIETLQSVSEPLCKIFCVSLADPFHEIKKSASRGIVLLVGRDEELLVGKSESLLMALLPNISHTHSRVRMAVLQAVDAIMQCDLPASLIAECLVPSVRALAFDRARGVRELCFDSVARWLGYTKGVKGEFQPCIEKGRDPRARIPQLLPLLLLGISDESPDVATASASLLEGVGEVYEAFLNRQHLTIFQEGVTEDLKRAQNDCILPVELGTVVESRIANSKETYILIGGSAAFKGRPSKGCRMMVQDFFAQLVRPALKDLREWTVGTRLGAARLLHTLLVLSEGYAIKHLDAVILTLCSAVGDDDVAVASRVIEAAHVLGCHVCPDDWLPLVLDHILTPTATLLQIANGLVILSGLLHATPMQAMNEQAVIKISQGLSQLNLGFSDQPAIRRQLLAVMTNLVQVNGPLSQPASLDILIILLQLQSSETDAELKQAAFKLVESLAKAIGLASPKELYEKHLESLIPVVTAGHEEWSGNSPERCLFQVFMQNAGRVVGPYLQMLLQIFTRCVHPDRDPALRINFLQLLDELFEIPELAAWWPPHASEIVGTIFIPCGIWQVGKVGAAIRYAAMVALGTFLRRDLCNQVQLVSLMRSQQLLAVTTSCLEEDYYVDTRRAACHVMENMLRVTGSLIDDEQRNEISKVLQKRLDDSSDLVRLGILPAISYFFHTMPDSYSDSSVKSFLSSIMLHMADSNIQIQEAVYKAATICATRKPAVVEEVVRAVCGHHQMAEYRESLLAHVRTANSNDGHN